MDFIKSLKTLYPVGTVEKIQKFKRNFSIVDMENRNTFSKYVFNLHNHINTMLGKNILTYEEGERDMKILDLGVPKAKECEEV